MIRGRDKGVPLSREALADPIEDRPNQDLRRLIQGYGKQLFQPYGARASLPSPGALSGEPFLALVSPMWNSLAPLSPQWLVMVLQQYAFYLGFRIEDFDDVFFFLIIDGPEIGSRAKRITASSDTALRMVSMGSSVGSLSAIPKSSHRIFGL